MSLPYTRPGVAINVVGTPSVLGSGATGGLGAIIGTAPKGYGGANPLIYTSLADVIRDYGDPAIYGYPTWTIPLAAQLYFSQAGIGTGLRPGLLIERIGAVAGDSHPRRRRQWRLLHGRYGHPDRRRGRTGHEHHSSAF
jgi:hypothetical protein